MKFFMSFIRTAFVVGLLIQSSIVGILNADMAVSPQLLNDSDYSEYWEQQFLFDDQTLVTSQFLIANLPFSKHHGMMVATLKQPEKKAIVIKNGRKRGGWAYDPMVPSLNIFQHTLKGVGPDFSMSLHNTAAELDVTFTTAAQGIAITSAGNKFGLPQITQYAPTAVASGRWRPGPEIGGVGPDGTWHDLGHSAGYGLHVVQKTSPKNLRQWRRLIGTNSNNGYLPILHVFDAPDGGRHVVMILVSQSGETIAFQDTAFESGALWAVKSHSNNTAIEGKITLNGQLELFNLKDQLSAIEQLAAGSMADVRRQRYTASYSLKYTKDNMDILINGNAIAEDIILGEAKPERRRRRR